MEAWIEFIYNDKVIGSYTVRGTFAGEMQATKELLAADYNTTPENIKTRIVDRYRLIYIRYFAII